MANQFGWTPMPAEVDRVLEGLRYPMFADLLWLSGSGEKKLALLYQCVVKVAGAFPVRTQTIGSCVAQGMACAVDVLKCVEIDKLKQNEAWIAETATEPIYAGSRVDIGGGKLGRRDGSVGAWAAEYVTLEGAIPRGVYGDIDLTAYSGKTEREWGMPRAGVPRSLKAVIEKHPVNAATLVMSYSEARDAIANGYPVTVASDQGFTMKRDAQGFAKPRGSWAHQMCFVAVDDSPERPGLLCMNSWGPDWISGPTRHDQPPGSFWVDADVATRMLRQGDSFALAGYEGFPRQTIDWSMA